MPADAEAAHGDDADLLVVPVAELMAQRLVVGAPKWRSVTPAVAQLGR
jgi:hypothetical protein